MAMVTHKKKEKEYNALQSIIPIQENPIIA